MGLPHIFQPGEVANAQDVNENFEFLMSIIGELSTPSRQTTLSEFLLGLRSNTLLTGTQDDGVSSANRFFQIGYNADWNLSGGAWKFLRFDTGWGATALRLGPGSLSVFATDDTGGSLNARMHKIFGLTADAGEGDYMYLPKETAVQHVDRVSTGIQDFRLTKVFLTTPRTIFENQALNASTVVYTATDYGVDIHAKAICVTTDVVSTSGYLKLYAEQAVSSDRHVKYGFVSRNGGAGDVQLGQGSKAGKFVIERTGAITSASVYVTGYLV